MPLQQNQPCKPSSRLLPKKNASNVESDFPGSYDKTRYPLLNSESEDDSYDLPTRSQPIRTRHKMKLKPEAIVIHPGDSNLARADAAAQELGIAGDTERVTLNRYVGDQAWEYGKGRDIARQLLGGTTRHAQDVSDEN